MKTLKLTNQEASMLIEYYDWNLATDNNDKKLFSTANEFNSMTMQTIFNQFDFIEVDEQDNIFGVYSIGQRVMVAKAPNIFEVVQELKVQS